MKKLLCVVMWVLPVMLFAQSPFDGTWKTNMAESKLSQKPYVFSVKMGIHFTQVPPIGCGLGTSPLSRTR
jgi:hypothetical protein